MIGTALRMGNPGLEGFSATVLKALSMKSYGLVQTKTEISTVEAHLEGLARQGFTVLEDVLTADEVSHFCQRLDLVYEQQVGEVGEALLTETNERDLARCPLLYNEDFLKLATHARVHEVVSAVLGSRFLLHLQNGIINRPDREHHQSSWHRDLPYQHWTSSKPLALGCLFCLHDFNELTGGTLVLPGSHLFDEVPSADYVKRHETHACARAGSVILFDAMLYHRAGHNQSGEIRRGVNHVFCTEILKQQLDLPRALAGKYADDPQLNVLLGYASEPPVGVKEYRERRAQKVRA